MHHNNNTHTFIDSLLQSQHQFMQAMADHRDQLSETMSTMAHTYLDTSIDRLKAFHDHVANDASGLKSNMLVSTLKAAIDQHQHLKDRLTVHKQHANSHKETLRRLAMGVMATFGVMSGLKAADAADTFESQENAESNSTTLAETDTAAEMRRAELKIQKYAYLVVSPKIDSIFEEANDAAKYKKYDRAVENYMKYANEYYLQPGEDHSVKKYRHRFVFQSSLFDAAENVARFGEKYYPDAVKLFMMVLNHENPILGKQYFKDAADRVASFGEEFYPQAVELYLYYAKYKHSEEAIKFRDNTVRLEKELDPNGDGAERTFDKYYDGKIDYIDLANIIAGLGKAFNPKAAEVLKLSADDQDITPNELSVAADSLILLGEEFKPELEYVFSKLGDHKDASPFYKLETAKGLFVLGNTEEAAKLFKEVIQDKNSQESYIAAAREALARLSSKKSESKGKK